MALIIGTNGDDVLYGFDGEEIHALAGSDFVGLTGGWNIVRAGNGNDQVDGLLSSQSGEVWGGLGNDYLTWGSGTAIGGKGHDVVQAFDNCVLYGEEGPGLARKVAGNDILRPTPTPTAATALSPAAWAPTGSAWKPTMTASPATQHPRACVHWCIAR